MNMKKESLSKLPPGLEDEMRLRVGQINAPSLLKSPARRLLSLQSLKQKYREGAHWSLHLKQDMGLPRPSGLRPQASGTRDRESHLGLPPFP